MDVSSFILSHDLDEASLFLADWVKTEADFTKFLSLAFPSPALAGVRESIEKKYPSIAYDYHQKQRMRTVLRDSTFVCNNYQVYKAYKNDSQVYAARYEIPPAQHGTDLLPIIWNNNVQLFNLVQVFGDRFPGWLANLLDIIWVSLATRYQIYFAGHALSGDPNHLLGQRLLPWEKTTDDGEELTNAMKIGLQYTQQRFYQLGADSYVSATNCDFWNGVARSVSDLMSGGINMEKKPHRLTKQNPNYLRGGQEEEL